MSHLIPVFLAPFLDRLLGEPAAFHPLVGFGSFANAIDTRFNQGTCLLLRGSAAWIILTLPPVLAIYYLDQFIGGIWLSVFCGWLAMGWQSLRQHGQAVVQALQTRHLADARKKTAYLVSRDTSALNPTEIRRATIESILENGSDAIFAPLFWLLIAGAPGVVFYRLCNTLDAMWGYRTARYEQFGKLAARTDDLLNLVPARLTALLYALNGHYQQAMQAWKTQGKRWYSPNAGVVMAAGAGALGLKLGGAASYHGQRKQRPDLGHGNPPGPGDIQRALSLVDRSVYSLQVITLMLAGGFWLAS
ncbi:MAG TPA: cobalamin biosynthesis protein CobD [Gammaproteobacteria bacterium]|nr:cobalamin biosynthesis protein CobD [Gammaproteobacteria bacterium]